MSDRGRLSRWWVWTPEGAGTKPIFVRALLQTISPGIADIGRFREKLANNPDPLFARKVYHEIALWLYARAELPYEASEFLAESFERIAMGEDCSDVFFLRRKRGDKRFSESVYWARICVIETLRFDHGLTEHKAIQLLCEYFHDDQSTYRKMPVRAEFRMGAKAMLERGDAIAAGPGLDDLVTLIPHLFPNHKK